MKDFKEALEQAKNGQKITKFCCESKLEQHILAIINKSGLEGLPPPANDIEQLLQLLAIVESKEDPRQVANILAASEGVLYTTSTDITTAYQKNNPTGVLPYAKINSVGGMSYKSKNLLVLGNVEKTTKSGIAYSITNGVVAISGKPTAPYTSIVSQSIYNLLEDGKTYTLRCNEIATNPNMFAQINIVKNDDNREYYSLNKQNSIQFTINKSLHKDAIFLIQSGKELVEVSNLTITPEIVLENGITHSKVISINELFIPTEVQSLDGYGLGVNDTYYNYIDFENKKYIQRVAVYTFDGTENWEYNETLNTATSGLYRFTTDVIANKVKKDFENVTDIAILPFGNTDTWREEEDSIQVHPSTRYTLIGNIFVFNSKVQSDIEMKKYMKGKTIVYALENPIETDISHCIDNGYIKVTEGGSIIFENEYKNEVPNSVTYQLKK